jgi:hypothetical protein
MPAWDTFVFLVGFVGKSPGSATLGYTVRSAISHQCLDFASVPGIFPSMAAATMEKVAEQALGLPIASRALLVEKLLDSLSGKADSVVERAHLDEVRRRRHAVRSGTARLIDGDEALRRARAAMRQ